jgi:DnaJ-class molecular chaperone
MARLRVECLACGGKGHVPRPGSDFPAFCDRCSGTGKVMAEVAIPEPLRQPAPPPIDRGDYC